MSSIGGADVAEAGGDGSRANPSRFLGIDYDTYKATLALLSQGLPVDAIQLQTANYREKKKSGDTFAIEALRQVYSALSQSSLLFDADAIAIERGRGMNRKGEWEMGAYFGAVMVVVARLRPEIPIAWIEVREWKREVTARAGWRDGLGNANAPKPDAHRALLEIAPYLHPGLTAEDFEGLTPDELDAISIAWTHRRMSGRAT